MISAAGRSSSNAAAKCAARKALMKMRERALANLDNNNSRRTISSTSTVAQSASSAISNMIPESVKEAVKSSILDEASRHDSKIWGDSNNVKSVNGINGHAQGKQNYTAQKSTNLSLNDQNSKLNGYDNCNLDYNQSDMNINNPISPVRLQMLNDPLDEWYLHSKPKYSDDNESSKNKLSMTTIVTNSPSNDPFLLSKSDMEHLSEGIRRDLIGSDHPVLAKAASYFFEEGKDGGKKLRPMMVLLLSRAMAHSFSNETTAYNISSTKHQTPPLQSSPMPKPQAWQRQDLPQAQRRLAEISEMIHTASLFHDDVIDGSDTRRGSPSVHSVFGNKVAILAGDYLLARASIFLARLRDVEVVETMSTIIEHLVRGEVMQMKGVAGTTDSKADIESLTQNQEEERLVYYLRKNFYKTASLMANSCKSAALLGGYNDEIVSVAYKYGKHLGVAFQLVDDVLDFDGSASLMGKPLLADLNAGLATAPVLFAAQTYPDEMQLLMGRKFQEEGDVERAVELVRMTDGIQRTKELAQVHAELAVEAALELSPSVYRDSLIRLACKVVNRSS